MMYTGKQLRALVMPLMFEQFLNVMVGMVDTLMVSKALPRFGRYMKK